MHGLDNTLLRCLEPDQSKHTLVEVYEGIYGSHLSRLTLAHKLIIASYYQPNMEKEDVENAKSCKQCQLNGNLIHVVAKEFIPFIIFWPFQQCSFDLEGQIHPSSSNGHKFIIISIDYFTKWVELVPLSIENGKIVTMFILSYIIFRYGVPSSIVTHNGGKLQNKDLKSLCSKFKIHQHWSSIYYPQGNGQEEASNKTILKILLHIVYKSR